MLMFRHTRHAAHHLRRVHYTDPMKIAPLLLPLLTPVNAFSPQKTTIPSRSFSSSSLLAMPICILVEAEIKEDRMEEFLEMIEKNAVASRQEPGCIRFGEWWWWFHRCLVSKISIIDGGLRTLRYESPWVAMFIYSRTCGCRGNDRELKFNESVARLIEM